MELGEEVDLPALRGNQRPLLIALQKRWRCRDCNKPFSVTSGTVFHHHKLPLQMILGGMILYANAVKGLSALQLSRDLDVQYKTAYVLLHKLLETIWKNRDDDLMTGEVEVDGGYMHTYVRPKNKIEDRADRRLAENQNPNKWVILVLRERYPPQGVEDATTDTCLLVRNGKMPLRVVGTILWRAAQTMEDV